MKIAGMTLCARGAAVLADALERMDNADLYLHESVSGHWGGQRFDRIVALTRRIFPEYDGLVYAAPCGVVVRAIAGCCRHKTIDPAVVVLDIGGRYAISLLSGHEGGANALALDIANTVGAEPVMSTSSEAAKRLIVGVGCRRGITAGRIVHAVEESLRGIDAATDSVRLLATADIKAREPGIVAAARQLDLPLRIIASQEIKQTSLPITRSGFVERSVGVPAVAEPAALLAGRRTRLRLPKTAYNGITIAIAEESCIWSG